MVSLRSIIIITPTSYPNLVTQTLICHDRCPGTCLASVEKFNVDPTFQTIGLNVLKRVLAERGLRIGKNQGEMVAELEKCDDFSHKNKHEKAYATELFADRGHYCLFGVKYHAELAYIERFWMWLKN